MNTDGSTQHKQIILLIIYFKASFFSVIFISELSINVDILLHVFDHLLLLES